MKGTCLNLTFTKKLLIEGYRSLSKSINNICDHVFKSLLGSVISTDMSEYVAKFRLVSILFVRLMATHIDLSVEIQEQEYTSQFLRNI